MKVSPIILKQEFVGLYARVVKSLNPYYIGLKGRVIEETRNTLVILHKNKKKTVVKDAAVFHLTLSDGSIVEIDGKAIIGRPDKRVRRRVRKRW